jgi:hypothetical protein
MKRILFVVALLSILAACSKKDADVSTKAPVGTASAGAATGNAAPVVAPAPPKPEGGPSAPELTPEQLKQFQK